MPSSPPDASHEPGGCDLPECHAPVAGRGRRYCCEEHAALGRNRANARARAVAAERDALAAALTTGQAPQHVGFLTTTEGVVITGQAVLELEQLVARLDTLVTSLAEAAQTRRALPVYESAQKFGDAARATAELARAFHTVLRPGRTVR